MGWGTDDTPGPGRQDEILFEFTQIGGQMRVAAIDGRTGVEVIIVAPLTASRIQMQNVARAKLRRRLEQGA